MLGSGRFFYKKVESVPKAFNARLKVRHCTSKSENKIIIPARIKREPTDILKALASTIHLDPTAFHYKYPDDPFLYPYTRAEKRVFALSLESGRKAARYVFKENPGFFKHQLADPPIEAFLQKIESKSETETEATEQSLLCAIEERNVGSAIKIYEALKAGGQDVQNSTKQTLLEVVCFYNGNDKPDLDEEMKWYEGYLGVREESNNQVIKWNADGFAVKLFGEMDQNCPLAVSAMIQGLLKYNEFESAVQLYNSAVEKNMKLSVGVYNSFILQAPFIVATREKITDFVLEKLEEMSKKNIRPNLGTLNATLKSFSKSNRLNMVRNLLQEFVSAGVRPSLGSYGYLIQVSSKLRVKEREDTMQARRFVEKIMDGIEDVQHEIMHPSDLDFFVSAMDCMAERFNDCDLALRLHDMYSRHGNSKFVVKASHEHSFYRQLFFIIFKQKPIEFAMDFYRRHVFTSFNPESRVLTTIIEAIHESLTPEYLVEFWGDLEKLAYSKNRPILGRIFALMKDFTDEASLKVFHQAAINFLDKWESEKSTTSGTDEKMFPDVLLALVKNGDEERISKLIQKVKDENIYFDVAESTVEDIMDLAILNKNVPLILETLRLAVHLDVMSTGELVKKCLPLLRGSDEAWASSLLAQQSERTRRKPEKEKEQTGGKEQKPKERIRAGEGEQKKGTGRKPERTEQIRATEVEEEEQTRAIEAEEEEQTRAIEAEEEEETKITEPKEKDA